MTTLEELAAKWEREAAAAESAEAVEAWQQCARELRAFSAWRPVSAPPADAVGVLGSTERGRMVCCYRAKGKWRDSGATYFPTVTHWMPLPAPPAA